MTGKDILQDDCARCAALCCMAHAFDAGHGFGLDKEAGVACPNLARAGRCTIHETRATQGFDGCISYSCAGAGPRVTQEIFGGESWQDRPDLTLPMMQAFQKARRLHEWLLLLREAKRLELTADQIAQRQDLVTELTPPGPLTEAWLAANVRDKNAIRLRGFLTSLRAQVKHPKRP